MSDSRPAIEVTDVSKLYRRTTPGYQMRTLKSALMDRSLTHGLSDAETIRAIEDLSFSVEPGVYLEGDFGVRSEVDVLIPPDGPPEVTGRRQQEMILLLADDPEHL